MGLLDQVLGQVLGGGSRQSGSLGGGLGQGGLGGLLSGNRASVAMALLALLASKHLSSGAGGYGSALHDMFSGGNSSAGTGSGAAPAGGILDKLGSLLGGGSSPSTSGPMGGLGGLLGGGMTGGALASGLGDLLSRFEQNGHGSMANSWVGSGPNEPLSSDQLDQVLDRGTVDELSRQTGMDRGDLLSQLSAALPQVVDKLTPRGHLPTEAEHSEWV